MRINVILLFIAFTIYCPAQTDSLIIETMNGAIQSYQLSMIEEISFSNIPTSAQEQELMKTILSSFAIHQNFPNPFNPMTTIQYDIPHDGEVNIAVYDIKGSLVRMLANLTQQAGKHRVVWDTRNNAGAIVSSGTYFCRIDFNNAVLVKKLILIR